MWYKQIKQRFSKPRPATTGVFHGAQQPSRSFLNRLFPSGEKSAPQTFRVDEQLLRRLERLTIEAQRMLAGNPNSGEHPSRQRLPTAIFSDHRPYSPGDDYRTIDWNAYARHEQIVVKLGETEQDVSIHVLIDCSRSMAFGEPSKLVAAQQLAAAIGYLGLAHSDRVRITPFRAKPLAGFGPAQSKNRAIDMVRFIADIRSESDTNMVAALQHYARQHERGGILVICSDLLTSQTDSLTEALHHFVPPRWQVLVVHMLDRRELTPDIGDTVDLEDAETGERIAMQLDAASIEAYKHNVAAWQERLAAVCAQRGATYVQTVTDWPFERTVIPYLRLRRIIT